MSVFVAPIRCVLIILTAILVWFLANREVKGSGDKNPDDPVSKPKRHQWYVNVLTSVGEWLFWFGGFSVKVVGKLADPQDAPILVCAPHSTIVDGLMLPHANFPSVVSRSENQHMPLVGKLITMLRPIYVSREERSSRTATINRIKNRVKSIQSGHPGYRNHLLLFPEGTCTNRSCLITFKPGAFMSGCPVQPILLRFHNPIDTYSWTFQGQNAGACLWFTLCQPVNRVTVEFLPVYRPSEEETRDPYLYAKNVRQVMADALGIPTSDHTFEDCRLMQYAQSKNYPMSAALVEFDSVRRKLGLSFEDLQKLLARFSNIDKQRNGKIKLSQLAKHLSLPVIEPVRELFSLYDTENTGEIDFRDFISGLALVSEPEESENPWKSIFDIFDGDGDGKISEQDLSRVLGRNYGMDQTEIENFMALMDTDCDGLVSFEDMMRMIKKRPEYNGLLLVYRRMRRQSFSEPVPPVDGTLLVDEEAEDISSDPSENSTEEEEVFGEGDSEEAEKNDDTDGISELKHRRLPVDEGSDQ